jgi:hypothetical protein
MRSKYLGVWPALSQKRSYIHIVIKMKERVEALPFVECHWRIKSSDWGGRIGAKVLAPKSILYRLFGWVFGWVDSRIIVRGQAITFD